MSPPSPDPGRPAVVPRAFTENANSVRIRSYSFMVSKMGLTRPEVHPLPSTTVPFILCHLPESVESFVMLANLRVHDVIPTLSRIR
jgi:hypothetical protein